MVAIQLVGGIEKLSVVKVVVSCGAMVSFVREMCCIVFKNSTVWFLCIDTVVKNNIPH